MRKIIHIDMDAFYASVEQRDAPELKGKPVVVGGAPGGRGVVAAASYEARKYGIHSAMPAYRALRRCPQAIFVRPRFERYKEISHQIREIFYAYTELVEPLSLDEAYLDITENKKGLRSAREVASLIKADILRETGLVASAGIAINKFLAKMASDIDKPDGLYVIPPHKMHAYLEQLPVGKFHGIGKATEAKMLKRGIKTGADLKQLSEQELRRSFGKIGHFYYNIVRGNDDRPVTPNRIRKSVGAENTFSENLESAAEIQERLRIIAAKVADRLKQAGAKGKTITLKVRYDSFESVTRSQTLPEFVEEEARIYALANELTAQTQAGERPVRLLGITLSSLNLELEAEAQTPPEGPGHQLSLEFE